MPKRKLNLGEGINAISSETSLRMSDDHHESKRQKSSNIFTGRPFSSQYYSILKVRQTLPVWEQKAEFLETYHKNQVLVLVGETGSGKTTQVPQFIVEDGFLKEGSTTTTTTTSEAAASSSDSTNASHIFRVACTQPRRVAAMSVAKRVADELDVELGEEVGYSIRFDDCSSPNTRLKYLTDGMLLREAMHDPLLTKYSCIILDEAHERTISTDILMGLLKDVLPKRKDLKLIVMSATLEYEKFQKFYWNCPLMKVPGRVHPVSIFYTSKTPDDYLEAAISTVCRIHVTQDAGDVLVFLTGEQEIEEACSRIRSAVEEIEDGSAGPVLVLPLYSSLPPYQQKRIFDRAPDALSADGPPGRKIIVSTNIAETSLTIDGVVYVVDPGFSKQKVYDPKRRTETLAVAPVSKASAKQRTGRAGRTRPGKCFRLYTKRAFEKELKESTPPEILRSNLSTTFLYMLKLGIENILRFDFLDAPAPEIAMRALEVLIFLGAIDDNVKLTSMGRLMAEFPLDPQLGRLLVNSARYECTSEALTIAAMLSVPNCFIRPSGGGGRNKSALFREANIAKAKFAHPDGDHITLMNVFHAYKQYAKTDRNWCWDNYINERTMKSAVSVRVQLLGIMERLNVPMKSADFGSRQYYNNIRKCLTSAFFMQTAYLNRSGMYITPKEMQAVRIHPSSTLESKPKWVVYHEFVLTTRTWIRYVTRIEPQWQLEMAPNYFQFKTMPDTEGKRSLLHIASTNPKLKHMVEEYQKQQQASTSSTTSTSTRRSTTKQKRSSKKRSSKKKTKRKSGKGRN